ncbi:MAG: flagellar motor stator protein MotA [Candidatus Nitrohelix vancouverensis]|uniref:Flagellar motor stator protein MotA n=1 Tax=Candidatus Nitrohelix vancouverensis TaxID=2705534 RepID=A0A7T0C3G3_9BACT|nr:MAG: flagellar motor stator protein MotA [Candidatus Nitrohelix vancouverensis]
MGVIVGLCVVFGCVVGGYLMAHGALGILWQPAEFVIIFGAAFGVFIITSSGQVMKNVLHSMKGMLSARHYTEKDYMELLQVLNSVFSVVKKQGLVALEAHLDKPQKSPIFARHKNFLKNEHALHLTTDSFRMLCSSKMEAHQLDSLMEAEIDAYHEEMMASSKNVANIGDSLPGLGIVAAVLGVVITMQKINEPPEVLGHHIGAALVGTFIGILGAYGVVGPLAKKMEWMADQEKEYLNILRYIIVGFVGGLQPQICIEFGRIMIPEPARPTFLKAEKILKN